MPILLSTLAIKFLTSSVVYSWAFLTLDIAGEAFEKFVSVKFGVLECMFS